MNKAQARRYCHRWICGLIDNFEQYTKEPFCYDDPFSDTNIEGRRLSAEDLSRVEYEMAAIYQGIVGKGWSKYHRTLGERRGPSWSELKPKPSGKPGAKWKGWNDFKRRHCR